MPWYLNPLFWVAALWVFLVTCWVLYLAVMNLAAHRDGLHPVTQGHGMAVLCVGLFLDFVLNVVVGTVVFVDLPHELKLTQRLKRYHKDAKGTWRDRLATWICTHLLNPFDPKGGHC